MDIKSWCLTLLLCGTAHAAAPRYHLSILDTVEGNAVAINNAGDIVGNRWGTPRGNGVVWHGGQLAVLPASIEHVTAISSLGHIVGTSPMYMDESGMNSSQSGFLYYQGQLTGLPDAFYQTTAIGFTYSTPTAVNRDGVVAMRGESSNGSGSYLATPLQYTIIPVDGRAINDAGTVAGANADYQAALYADGKVTTLGTLPGDGFQYSVAFDINDAGVAVGFSTYGYGSNVREQSFLYQNGQMQMLGNFTLSNSATAINNLGTVIGDYTKLVNGNPVDQAYLYQDGSVYDLQTLLENPAGWKVGAADINDSGLIVGSACNAQGNCFAALLTPVPEPAQGAMLLAGMAVLGWRGRKSLRAAVLVSTKQNAFA